jgi:predicted dehydrogenase
MTQLALLGAAHIHTPGFINAIKKRGDDVRVKYVWDPDAVRAKKRAEELGAEVVTKLDRILRDEDVSAVVVCSETDLHEELVLPAAAAKKDMFVEKPLGMTAKDAYAMADAVERAGVLFQTGYFMRGDPRHLFLKQHVAQGSFGRITRVRGANCHSGSLNGWFDAEWRWMADPKRAGCGAFGDLGTHSLDIMLWLFGDVAATTAMVDPGTRRYGETDETGEGLIRFKNGTIGTLAAAWTDLTNPVSLQISGTEGIASIINGQVHFQSKVATQYDGSSPVRLAELPKAQAAGFELFLDAVTHREAPNLVGVREAAYRVSVVEAMYEGSRSGAWVTPR